MPVTTDALLRAARPRMPEVRYIRYAVVDKVVDVDTGAVLIDLVLQLHARDSCRIVTGDGGSIDTPERGQPNYARAVDYARTLLEPGDRVVVESVRMKDKYGGRFDGVLWLPNGTTFAENMIAAGFAKVWREGEPKPFPRAGQ